MTRLNAALVFIRRATLRLFAVAYTSLAVLIGLAILLDCVR